MTKRSFLQFPVVSAGAEHLVMGMLMRRNILTYKAPPMNEGYDLICIHPDPRHKLRRGEKAQLRVQVKSRYQTDCSRGFPVKEKTLNAFDYLIAVFLNIGAFYNKKDGLTGAAQPEFFTFPASFIRKHHDKSSTWEKVNLGGMDRRILRYKDQDGFEQIAKKLGVEQPQRGPT